MTFLIVVLLLVLSINSFQNLGVMRRELQGLEYLDKAVPAHIDPTQPNVRDLESGLA